MVQASQCNPDTDHAASVALDIEALDLQSIETLEGTALGDILREVQDERSQPTQARHSSHSSYSTHGTGAW